MTTFFKVSMIMLVFAIILIAGLSAAQNNLTVSVPEIDQSVQSSLLYKMSFEIQVALQNVARHFLRGVVAILD